MSAPTVTRPAMTPAQMFDRYHAGLVTAAEWDAWNAERLGVVLRHVTERSDFYRRHLAGIDLDLVTPGTLERLPFTTKADLRREGHAMLSGTVADALIYYETTGTTGPSTPCPRGRADIETSNAFVAESWRRTFGDRFGDRMPVVALMGPSELYAFGDTFGAVAERIGACHAKIWPESPRVGFGKALRLLRDLRAEVVVCAPALCMSLAKAALHHGYDLSRDFAVEQFLVLGEVSTPALAANVASVWNGAAVHPTLYGAQETLAVATGCPHRRLHLSRPNYLAEILDPATGERRGWDGTGELCLTMLVDGIKPLVRYRTGDLVELDRTGCDCGMAGPTVNVLGRVADQVPLGSVQLHPAEIEELVLTGVSGCLGYEVVIDRDRDGGDAVTVRMDLMPTDGPVDADGVRAGLAERFRDRCGVSAGVAVTSALDPVTTTGSFVSWKAARIHDRRLADNAERDVAASVAHRYAVTT